ncbi:MAG: PDZ domain-containing protein [candidate division Zixibacteria bacterium]|nr:PDZ domain-containing protein [candidate division Zixibacteria bacterium]
MILDTGMPIEGAILFGSEKIDKMNLSYVGKAPIMGAGGTTVKADLAMNINFKLPGASFSGQMVMVMPFDADRNNYHEGKNGIIGSSLFKHFVVSIDFNNMKITLTNPEQFSYTGKGEAIPLEIARYPMLKCETEMESGAKVPLNLIIDTGNSDALTLNVGSAKAIVPPNKTIETYKVSLKNEIPVNIGRVKEFRIGGFQFKNVLCSFSTQPPPPWSKEGNLGQGILKRFNVTFDYSRQVMYLAPNDQFNDPFDINMAGISFLRTENGLFRITRVYPDSPAADAGLKQDDLLKAIDDQIVTTITKDEAYRLLQKKSGQEVTLEVLRDGSPIKVIIPLRRLI